MITNPALAKVVNLNCDVFSLVEIKRKDDQEDDELIKLLKNPNYFQSQRQFLWTYRFWTMFGSAYLKPSSKRIENDLQQLYWLEAYKLDFKKLENDFDKLVLSKKGHKSILETSINYKYSDGSKIPIRMDEMVTFHDLTNGLGNWFKGSSRIDSLWKVLGNAENSLDSKSVNLNFSKKFLVSGSYDPSKDLNTPMQNVEKEDIRKKLKSSESVYPVKAQIDIKRFVEDFSKLKLDESYVSDLLIIADMYGVPKELISVLIDGATYENQEKAIGRHIGYSETPKAKDLLEGLCTYFDKDPTDYEITFANNSFMQVFEKDKATVNMTNAKTLETLVNNGADANEVAEMLGLDLTFKKPTNEQPSE